ncbi:DUF1566 domain-containing protein [Pseudomonas sp.]|uniref:DUF1566 domain-containing protein n=1 Tax=Pseudomonas sp. TaxID=306 RepID=UPI00258441D0|nr:DUF1566 domain-containing protein [Pseudomonas sp.]
MQPTINIQNLTLNVHAYQRAPALVALGAAIAAAAAPAPEAAAPADIPAVGQIWPGQGGINGGFVPARGDVPEHYLIIATKDVGEHEWGGRGIESAATSKTDGLTNTEALAGDDDHKYPAASACAEYQADGYHDFYLPAAAELYQAWVNCPEALDKAWYWSSTQRSANNAFGQDFVDGTQSYHAKGYQARVRPVRRLFI